MFSLMEKLSNKIISRVLLYIRILEELIKKNRVRVSSNELAKLTGLSDVQIRKDISKFGKVGTPRLGYNTIELKGVLEDFVLHKKTIQLALFGVGNLGTAILKYPAFRKDRLNIAAAFDKDKNKIGRTINSVRIYSIDKAPEIIKKTRSEIGIVAVGAQDSQEVVDIMVLSGLKGIINFAPVFLNAPKDVIVRDIDLSLEFLALYCSVKIME